MSREGYVSPKATDADLNWLWLSWLEEDGTRVAHYGPSNSDRRQTAACGVGVPFYATELAELDELADEVCDECRELEGEIDRR